MNIRPKLTGSPLGYTLYQVDGLGDDYQSWGKALWSFDKRLHWRCHFMQKLEDEPELEFRNLHRACDGLRPKTPELFLNSSSFSSNDRFL